MYKNIIIPVDLAHEERLPSMLAVAKRLAAEGASVAVLNVVENLPAFVAAEMPSDIMPRLKGDAEQSLLKLAETLDNPPEMIVAVGHPASAILDTAAERGADLIVIASHRPGFGDFLIGSTAARVVRHAQCSVHVVR